MFAALIEKLVRHEDLTDRRGGRGDGARSWKAAPRRRRSPALLVGLAMKGERPAEIVGFARTMRAHAVQLVGAGRATCSTPAAPAAIGRAPSTSRRARRWSSPPAACGSPSTATARCRAGRGSADVFEALGVHVAGVAGGRRADACTTPDIAFFFAPTFHPSMRHAGADAARARRPHRVQPARAADQSGRRARGSWSACRGRSSPSCWRGR